MSWNPYSFRTGALAGSAVAASTLVLLDPFICHPENSRGRTAGLSAAKAAADETIRLKIAKVRKSRMRRDTQRRTHYLCLLDYRGRGKVSRIGLLAVALGQPRRYSHTTQTAYVLGDTFVERFRNTLAVLGRIQLALVSRVTDKGYLGQDGGHIGADKNHKWCFLHPAIADSRILKGKAAMQRTLNIGGELARFFDLLFQGDLLHQILQFMDRFVGCGILSSRDLQRRCI